MQQDVSGPGWPDRFAPVGWGFLGAGGVARRQMLPGVRGEAGIRLAAVMVRDGDRARELAAEYGAAAGYDDVATLLNDPAVEAVYIATPPALHESQAVAACRLGKAVLLEKPMALDPAAARRIREAAERAGVLLAVCFPLRHHPAVVALRQRVESGWFGELVLLRAQLAKWYPLEREQWRADPEQAGGGVLMDLGSHLLDWVACLGGEATALTATLAQRVWDVPVEDTAVVQVELASGALATLELGFAVAGNHHCLEVYGTRGSGHWQAGQLRFESDSGTEPVPLPATHLHRAELLDFSRALRNGVPAATTATDGVRNIVQLVAAYESARSGRRTIVG